MRRAKNLRFFRIVLLKLFDDFVCFVFWGRKNTKMSLDIPPLLFIAESTQGEELHKSFLLGASKVTCVELTVASVEKASIEDANHTAEYRELLGFRVFQYPVCAVWQPCFLLAMTLSTAPPAPPLHHPKKGDLPLRKADKALHKKSRSDRFPCQSPLGPKCL